MPVELRQVLLASHAARSGVAQRLRPIDPFRVRGEIWTEPVGVPREDTPSCTAMLAF
jgi:hypothetical protein